MSVDRRQMTRLRSSVFTFSFDPTRRASVFALRASPRHVAAAGRCQKTEVRSQRAEYSWQGKDY